MDDEEFLESDLDGDDLDGEVEGVRSNVIKIYPKQQLFYELDCGIQGFVGGRGIGKTKIRVDKKEFETPVNAAEGNVSHLPLSSAFAEVMDED